MGKDSAGHTNIYSDMKIMEIRERKKKTINMLSKVVKRFSNISFLQIVHFDIICCLNKKVPHLREGLLKDKSNQGK